LDDGGRLIVMVRVRLTRIGNGVEQHGGVGGGACVGGSVGVHCGASD